MIRLQQHHPVPRHSEEDGEGSQGSHGCVAAHACSAQALAAPGSRDGNRRGVFFSGRLFVRPLGASGRSGSSGLLEKITLTTDETALLRQIGQQTKGPRHTMTLSADPRTIGTVNGLAEKGLAACTGFGPRVGGDELLRVCLTGKGWVKFRGLRSEHTERGDATND